MFPNLDFSIYNHLDNNSDFSTYNHLDNKVPIKHFDSDHGKHIKKEKEELFAGENEKIAEKYEIGFHTGFMKIYHNLWLCLAHTCYEDNLDGCKVN